MEVSAETSKSQFSRGATHFPPPLEHGRSDPRSVEILSLNLFPIGSSEELTTQHYHSDLDLNFILWRSGPPRKQKGSSNISSTPYHQSWRQYVAVTLTAFQIFITSMLSSEFWSYLTSELNILGWPNARIFDVGFYQFQNRQLSSALNKNYPKSYIKIFPSLIQASFRSIKTSIAISSNVTSLSALPKESLMA